MPSESSKSSWARVACAKFLVGRKSPASQLSTCEAERTLDQESGVLNSAPEGASS